jgi:hypothetical protein
LCQRIDQFYPHILLPLLLLLLLLLVVTMIRRLVSIVILALIASSFTCSAFAPSKSILVSQKALSFSTTQLQERRWNFNEGRSPWGLKNNAEIWNGRVAQVRRWMDIYFGFIVERIMAYTFLDINIHFIDIHINVGGIYHDISSRIDSGTRSGGGD